MCAVPMALRAFFQLVPSLPWVNWTVHIVRYSKTIGIMKRISNTAAEGPLPGSYMTPSYCVLTWWKCEGSLQNLFCKSSNSTHEGSNFMTWKPLKNLTSQYYCSVITTFKVRVSLYEFWGDIHISRRYKCVCVCFKESALMFVEAEKSQYL